MHRAVGNSRLISGPITGKIGAVGLSEVRAETIKRASAVTQIKYAEIEFSLWSTEMLGNGVAVAAKECNVSLLTYAPLGYGFLSGAIKKLEDIPQGDIRHSFGRFQPEVSMPRFFGRMTWSPVVKYVLRARD